jgi:hypothetical protein
METLQKNGYLCHPQQMYTLRRVTIAEGKAKNTAIIEVSTAGGLQLDILPDAGLDIGQVRYKGTNVTFVSKNGYEDVSEHYNEQEAWIVLEYIYEPEQIYFCDYILRNEYALFHMTMASDAEDREIYAPVFEEWRTYVSLDY